MEVQIGQRVYVPNPDGGRRVLATVVQFGEPDDAEEVLVEGRPTKRDVAIVQYEEGRLEGFTARIRYDLLSPIGTDPARRLKLTKEQTAYVNKRHAEGVSPAEALREFGIDLGGYDVIEPYNPAGGGDD